MQDMLACTSAHGGQASLETMRVVGLGARCVLFSFGDYIDANT
jgi:hypothetical protein